MDYKLATVLVALLLAASQFEGAQQNDFELFKARFGKIYRGSEDSFRQAVFISNIAKIAAHNADATQTYTMAVNQFTDMTQEEFESVILMPATEALYVADEDFVQVGDVNWVTEGAVQAVKDQGRCGSCWAFAGTAVAESFKYLETGTLGLFSDQQATSCDPRSSGCNGGWHYYALRYFADNGICTQDSYPYTSGTTGSTGTCMDDSCTRDSFTISGYKSVSGLSGLMGQLESSPVSVAVDAGNWSSYGGGIFSNCGTRLNHAVLAAGFTSDYTLIKNSWSQYWGEAGFIRLAPGNTCGVASRNYIPTL